MPLDKRSYISASSILFKPIEENAYLCNHLLTIFKSNFDICSDFKMKGPLFYSKILLFGEYGIIKDSKGLSIQYSFYKGALKTAVQPSAEALKSNKSLAAFAHYLEEIRRLSISRDQPISSPYFITVKRERVDRSSHGALGH